MFWNLLSFAVTMYTSNWFSVTPNLLLRSFALRPRAWGKLSTKLQVHVGTQDTLRKYRWRKEYILADVLQQCSKCLLFYPPVVWGCIILTYRCQFILTWVNIIICNKFMEFFLNNCQSFSLTFRTGQKFHIWKLSLLFLLIPSFH